LSILSGQYLIFKMTPCGSLAAVPQGKKMGFRIDIYNSPCKELQNNMSIYILVDKPNIECIEK
jgi:hypothetical protein